MNMGSRLYLRHHRIYIELNSVSIYEKVIYLTVVTTTIALNLKKIGFGRSLLSFTEFFWSELNAKNLENNYFSSCLSHCTYYFGWNLRWAIFFKKCVSWLLCISNLTLIHFCMWKLTNLFMQKAYLKDYFSNNNLHCGVATNIFWLNNHSVTSNSK